MPYTTIYKTNDGKWHQTTCPLVTKENFVEEQTIGSTRTRPDPPRADMCKECWGFLFKTQKIETQGGGSITFVDYGDGQKIEGGEIDIIDFET